MSPLDHPTWGGARPGAGRPRLPKEWERYSISRAIAQTVQGKLTGYEGELSQELSLINREMPLISHLRGFAMGSTLTVPLDLGFRPS